MALNIDLSLLQDNLFDAAKEASSKFIDDSEDQAKEFYSDLRDYTDNLAVLKKELAEAPDADSKKVKMQSIRLQQRAINSLVDKHKMIFNQQSIERVKEVIQTVAITAGKIGLSLLVAAV